MLIIVLAVGGESISYRFYVVPNVISEFKSEVDSKISDLPYSADLAFILPKYFLNNCGSPLNPNELVHCFRPELSNSVGKIYTAFPLQGSDKKPNSNVFKYDPSCENNCVSNFGYTFSSTTKKLGADGFVFSDQQYCGIEQKFLFYSFEICVERIEFSGVLQSINYFLNMDQAMFNIDPFARAQGKYLLASVLELHQFNMQIWSLGGHEEVVSGDAYLVELK